VQEYTLVIRSKELSANAQISDKNWVQEYTLYDKKLELSASVHISDKNWVNSEFSLNKGYDKPTVMRLKYSPWIRFYNSRLSRKEKRLQIEWNNKLWNQYIIYCLVSIGIFRIKSFINCFTLIGG